ncbi:MAG: Clp protease ClpP [Chryseobacterium sp.]
MILRTNENQLYVIGTIWSGDGMWFVSELGRLEKQYDSITIKVHLYGGSVFDGNLMCNAIEASKSNIDIDILGLAASMGGLLTMSSKNVGIVENGYIMLHNPKSGSYGEAKDLESSAELLRMMENNFAKKLSIRMGISDTEAKAILSKDTWHDAEKAKKSGLVSRIIPSAVETILPVEDPEDFGETEVYNMFSALLINPAAVGLPQNSQQIFIDNMKKSLIEALGLTKVTDQSSDTAVIDAVKEKITESETAKNNAEAELKTFKDAQITAMIEGAQLEDSEKEVYKKIGETSGVEALAIVLKSKAAPVQGSQAPNLGAMIQNGSSSANASVGRTDWDFKKWQTEDPRGLEKMSETDPEKFKTLFNANYK